MQTALLRPRIVLGLLALVTALFSLFGAMSALADDAEDKAALDKLFALLKDAPDPETAHVIDQRIWLHWMVPSDPVLAKRMQDVLAQSEIGNLPMAISLLDQMVVDYPTYAEAWNRRATFYYMLGDFEHSLADIDKVLQYEPRHFGALSGRVMIYLQQGKRALALKDMATALAIHPFISGRELFPELQRDMTRI